MSDEKTHYCAKCRKDVAAGHEHINWWVPRTTKTPDEWYYDLCDLCRIVGTGLVLTVLLVTAFFGVKKLYDWDQDQQTATAERSELQRCRLEQYVTTRTGHAPLETVDLDMKKTGTGVKITGDGLVLAADADPLDVFVATADECNGVLSSQYDDEPEPQRCRIEQYILEQIPSRQQVAALLSDLKLDTKNNDDITEITINGYVTFTNVDTAVMLSRHEACDTEPDP